MGMRRYGVIGSAPGVCVSTNADVQESHLRDRHQTFMSMRKALNSFDRWLRTDAS